MFACVLIVMPLCPKLDPPQQQRKLPADQAQSQAQTQEPNQQESNQELGSCTSNFRKGVHSQSRIPVLHW